MNSKIYFDTVAQKWEEMREGFFPAAVRICYSKASIRTIHTQGKKLKLFI